MSLTRLAGPQMLPLTFFIEVRMLRALCIAWALLIATALAHAASISSNLSVTVAPASGGGNVCGANAVPPGPAARAGYTKLLFCEDFSQSQYANISSWIDCNNTGAPGYDWYWYQDQGGCPDFRQTTDPTTGKIVMEFYWHSNTDPLPNSNGVAMLSSGQVCCTSAPMYFHDAPAAGLYTEIRFRATPKIHDVVLPSTANAYFLYGDNLPNNTPFVEYDNDEAWGGRDGTAGCCAGTNATLHTYWPPYPAASLYYGAATPGQIDPTVQHSYGWLATTDGSQLQNCAYIDDSLYSYQGQGCNVQTSPPTAALTSRVYQGLWLGGVYGLNSWACQNYIGNGNVGVAGNNSCTQEGGQPDTQTYIEYIRVWSCSDADNWYVAATGTQASGGADAYDTQIPCKSGLVQ